MKFCDKEIQDQLLRGGRIRRKSDKFPLFFNEEGKVCYSCSSYIHEYNINKKDLAADDWEIVDSYYDDIIANKILCFFWNGEDEGYDIGYLKSVNKKFSDYRFVGEILTNMGTTFDYYLHCKAVEGKKFNIMP